MNINKIKDFIAKNVYQIILIFLIVIFFLINLFELKSKMNSNDIHSNKYYLVFISASIIFSSIILIICKKSKRILEDKYPKVFVFTAIIIGSIFLVLSPLFSGSDEHNHYFRIYEITEGVLVTPTEEVVGSKLPKSLEDTFVVASGKNIDVKYKHIRKMQEVELEEHNTKQYGELWTESYNNTALYSPVQYLPQVIGFTIAKFLNFGPYIIGMFGRIFNLLFYVLIGYFCLKIMPKSKMFYLLILLSPNMLQCATTLSADAFTNGIFLLLIAFIFSICDRTEKINFKDKILLFILSVTIALCKIVYLPIVFLVLLIGCDKFKKGKKEKMIFSMITIIISVLFGLLWMSYTGGVFNIVYDKTELQKEFILGNIIEYSLVFIRTFSNYIVKYIECLFVGTTMYHSQLKMPALISFLYVFIMIIALLKNNIKDKFSILQKVVIAIVGILIIGLISTAIYVQCTAQYYSVGNLTIEGIQGRYFIPIIFLVPFILNFDKRKIRVSNQLLFNSALTINLITWFYMMNQFMV